MRRGASACYRRELLQVAGEERGERDQAVLEEKVIGTSLEVGGSVAVGVAAWAEEIIREAEIKFQIASGVCYRSDERSRRNQNAQEAKSKEEFFHSLKG